MIDVINFRSEVGGQIGAWKKSVAQFDFVKTLIRIGFFDVELRFARETLCVDCPARRAVERENGFVFIVAKGEIAVGFGGRCNRTQRERKREHRTAAETQKLAAR